MSSAPLASITDPTGKQLQTAGPAGKAKVVVSPDGTLRAVLPAPITVVTKSLAQQATHDVMEQSGSCTYQVSDMDTQTYEGMTLLEIPAQDVQAAVVTAPTELQITGVDNARWLFHAVHSVVTISESEGRPWAAGEPRINFLVVTGHDLPISELYAW